MSQKQNAFGKPEFMRKHKVKLKAARLVKGKGARGSWEVVVKDAA